MGDTDLMLTPRTPILLGEKVRSGALGKVITEVSIPWIRMD